MKYNIHITHAAERDMANAYDYICLLYTSFLVKKHLSTIQFLIFGRTYDWKSGRPT